MGSKARGARFAEANAKVIRRAAEQAHAALLVTVGTSGASTVDRIEEDLRFFLTEVIRDPGEDGSDSPYQHYHLPGGFVLYVNHQPSGPGDLTFKVLVPATTDYYFYDEKGD